MAASARLAGYTPGAGAGAANDAETGRSLSSLNCCVHGRFGILAPTNNSNLKSFPNNSNTSNNLNSFNFDPQNKNNHLAQMQQTGAFLDQNSKNITKIFDTYQQQVQQIDNNSDHHEKNDSIRALFKQ